MSEIKLDPSRSTPPPAVRLYVGGPSSATKLLNRIPWNTRCSILNLSVCGFHAWKTAAEIDLGSGGTLHFLESVSADGVRVLVQVFAHAGGFRGLRQLTARRFRVLCYMCSALGISRVAYSYNTAVTLLNKLARECGEMKGENNSEIAA